MKCGCDKPECDACEDGIDAVLAKQDKAMAEQGWYWHYVTNNDGSVNIHTHGLQETFQHDDFQIVLAGLPIPVYQNVLSNFVERIKNGDKFKDNDVVENIIVPPYKVRLTTTTEGERSVLRIIFPDKDGDLSKETQEELYAKQWD